MPCSIKGNFTLNHFWTEGRVFTYKFYTAGSADPEGVAWPGTVRHYQATGLQLPGDTMVSLTSKAAVLLEEGLVLESIGLHTYMGDPNDPTYQDQLPEDSHLPTIDVCGTVVSVWDSNPNEGTRLTHLSLAITEFINRQQNVFVMERVSVFIHYLAC